MNFANCKVFSEFTKLKLKVLFLCVDTDVEDSEVSVMNFSEIKSFPTEQPKQVRPEVALNKQLQQDGLKQAKELQQSFAQNNEAISDNRKVAARVLSGAINSTLSVNGQSADISPRSTEDEKENQKPLFDFEKVAKNVLSFVGGVINKAASNGDSDDKLTALFEQARTGVTMGIELAEKELGDTLNDEIAQGIAASKSSIFDGIGKLEDKVFGKSPEINASSLDFESSTKAEKSEFYVRTRDGDEVKVSFGLKEQYSSASLVSEQGNSASSTVFEQSANFSLAISGDLDDNELKAIGDLVAQADDIANTFYRGDIEEAFKQSLEIGYDTKELASFAFQLTKAESYQKVQKYDEVKNYSETAADLKAPKAVAQYLNKVLDGLNTANEQLENEGDFKAVINSLVNELKDVQVPDILTAINRFHSFNAKLLEGIEPQTTY